MARKRDPKRDEAFEIWKKHNGEITNRALAEQLDVSEKTLSGWKSKDKWKNKLNRVLQSNERNTPNKNNRTANSTKEPKSRGAPKNNRNAVGNKGNPNASAPKRNLNAMKHGLFSRYIPQETLELMGMLEKANPADLIWDQVQIQYAAIIRAQQIMYVADQDDMTKEVKKTEKNDGDMFSVEKEEYEIQFAWDKHASFLNAQSRARSEFCSLIKQFWEMSHENDERRLKIEQMQVGIERAKAEVKKLSGTNDCGPIEILIKWKGDG